jgi:hypothetical protein
MQSWSVGLLLDPQKYRPQLFLGQELVVDESGGK